MNTHWVIDATNRIHSIWHTCFDPNVVLTRVRAEIGWLKNARSLDRIGLAFDASRSFRTDVDPGYKSTRKPKEPGLRLALERAPEEVADLGEILLADSYEADDIMATVAAAAAEAGDRCVLVSPDKDLIGCLVENHVTLCRHPHRDKPWEWLTAAEVTRRFGVSVGRWSEFQMIVGDRVDNIRGWDGVGDVTAAKWLSRWSLAELLANEWLVTLNVKQRAGRKDFILRKDTVRQLVELRTDVPHVTDWM